MVFYKELINWYLQNNRDLPWRKTKNPYFIWLSEIMLQQTRVSQGLPYFLRFTEAFPTVFDLAKAEEDTVLKLWQGLGYYSRARNLHFTAKHVANELKGAFPSNYKDLLKLKGVGDYTASAIASICYKEPVAVVDGNVYRVLSRVFGVHTPINSTKGIKEFKELAQSLIDKEEPDIYNQAIMDFGAIHCKPQNPLCNSCKFSTICIAFNNNMVKELPVKEKKIKIKKRYFNYLVIDTNEGKTILEERKGKGIWQGLYQFPLIETKKAIDAQELVENPSFNEMDLNGAVIRRFNKKMVIHKLSHQHLYTQFWVVSMGTFKGANMQWTEVLEKPVPVLIEKFLNEYLVSGQQ
ncbi:A/G-specific DNA-adenine glycosylase [Tenacibaculum sp. MAR_2009_124]|uniref:A/G-specific adenine glycosylase n=1 Tax=Tenacibaculum sp. MAR_2009_124 TaxID=1250059 RepID=UPI00089A1CB4|nr:A/G-specific adenine glycosylase [Tenacibaculum sp. MAR_2009_124]SEC49391.1 A/G-specific DNA-adenine glycosylase [Tenacibaculum sp. MAR_2009_124]